MKKKSLNLNEMLLGIDIGGTFTDAIAYSNNQIIVAKVPSNPIDPAESIFSAIEALKISAEPAKFFHSTTLVTNMLLEKKGADTGFITNEGMRDILHIARHKRPLNYAIKQEISQQHHPPVPRKWRLTVPERISKNGEVIIPLDHEAVLKAVRKLIKQGVKAIAIGFLHSYRSNQHELTVKKIVEETDPKIFVCISSEVSSRFREYERFITTAWNARVAPAAGKYLEKIVNKIKLIWPNTPLTMMTSNGGLEEVHSPQTNLSDGKLDIKQTPIRLAISGPAAAGNAVVKVSSDLKLPNLVGLDVGGTSSDIVVVRDGRLNESPMEEREIGGYPLQTPMLDLNTIGAGGGSLVQIDEYGVLHVGPQSAGAEPGPACYKRGGQLPTVTDAAVIAGRLPKEIKLGGNLSIYPELSEKVFHGQFSNSKREIHSLALDILALAESEIALAIRERTVARGINPKEMSLVAAGGAGPLLACGVAETLELSEVIIPPKPGLLAAWGLLVAPERREGAATVLEILEQLSSSDLDQYRKIAFDNLSQSPPQHAELNYICSMRYLGQGFEVEIPLVLNDSIGDLSERFHNAHKNEYGFNNIESSIEWVEIRAIWEISAKNFKFEISSRLKHSKKITVVWERDKKNKNMIKRECKIIQRESMMIGTKIIGPAILAESDTTIYIPTGWVANFIDGGYLKINFFRNE